MFCVAMAAGWATLHWAGDRTGQGARPEPEVRVQMKKLHALPTPDRLPAGLPTATSPWVPRYSFVRCSHLPCPFARSGYRSMHAPGGETSWETNVTLMLK